MVLLGSQFQEANLRRTINCLLNISIPHEDCQKHFLSLSCKRYLDDILDESVLFILVRKSGKFHMKRGNMTFLTCIDDLCNLLTLSILVWGIVYSFQGIPEPPYGR